MFTCFKAPRTTMLFSLSVFSLIKLFKPKRANGRQNKTTMLFSLSMSSLIKLFKPKRANGRYGYIVQQWPINGNVLHYFSQKYRYDQPTKQSFRIIYFYWEGS